MKIKSFNLVFTPEELLALHKYLGMKIDFYFEEKGGTYRQSKLLNDIYEGLCEICEALEESNL